MSNRQGGPDGLGGTGDPRSQVDHDDSGGRGNVGDRGDGRDRNDAEGPDDSSDRDDAEGPGDAGDRDDAEGPGAARGLLRIVAMGERALIAELPRPGDVLALHEHVRRNPLPGQADLVPGAASLLIHFDTDVADAGTDLIAACRAAYDGLGAASAAPDVEPVTIDVVYDGADLDDVAALVGMSPQSLVAAHTAARWQVAFCGFSPGFAYLAPVADAQAADAPAVGSSAAVSSAADSSGAASSTADAPVAGAWDLGPVPRRDAPRDRIPAGSVGLAGPYSGIYPAASPGGWQLIGRTDAPLWDLRRDPPALLRPGMGVRFRAVRDGLRAEAGAPASRDAAASRADSASSDGATTANAEPGRRVDGEPEQRADGEPGQRVDGEPEQRTDDEPEQRTGDEPGQRTDGDPWPRAKDGGIVVVNPGMLSVVEDLGRRGWSAMGVSPSGAADRGAATRANTAVGNAADAAVLEMVLGGVTVEFREAATIAVTGATLPIELWVPSADRGGASTTDRSGEASSTEEPDVRGDADRTADSTDSAEMGRAIEVPVGTRVRLGRPKRGLRSYLAVRGGIDVEPVLGSRSTDLLAGLGPARVQAGDVLPIGRPAPDTEPDAASDSPPDAASDTERGPEPDTGPDTEREATPETARETANPIPELEVLPGPQLDWFTADAPETLAAGDWTVTASSNRVAVRLQGPAPTRAVTDELPSQGLVRGAIQVPPSGELVMFLADFPVTGGYPVIGVLTEASVDAAAQLRPGAAVRFRTR